MKKSIILFYGICLFVLTSCNTLSISTESQNKTTAPLILGSIGSGKEFILQNKFQDVSYPTYTKPIKISALKTLFNKSTYTAFLKAKKSESKNINVKYIDSIKEKPYYLEFKIADKVAIVNALNERTNNNVKDYLSINPSANLITNLTIALNKDHLLKNTI